MIPHPILAIDVSKHERAQDGIEAASLEQLGAVPAVQDPVDELIGGEEDVVDIGTEVPEL